MIPDAFPDQPRDPLLKDCAMCKARPRMQGWPVCAECEAACKDQPVRDPIPAVVEEKQCLD